MVAVYGEAMGYRADLLEARRGYIATHVRRPGFRAVATLTSEGHLVGFGYGYLGASGQWWHDQVHRRAARRRPHSAGSPHCFEVVELHVRPRAQGHGLGARPARARCSAWPSGGTTLLSTPEADEQTSRAWRLYRRFGFVDVLRRLPLPRRRPAVRRARPGPAAATPPASMTSGRLSWLLLAVLVLAQIGYPLTDGAARAGLTVATVVLGYLLSVGARAAQPGSRAAAALVAVTTGGGLRSRRSGVATGVPFGSYDYSGELGPKLAGVPLVIPLAWTWMAWPAWLAAVRLTGGTPQRPRRPDRPRGSPGGADRAGRVGLAAWDLFLDPQMVAEGYWVWRDATPALPGVPASRSATTWAGCSSRCC